MNEGSDLIKSVNNKLPFELNFPGYQYCGPRINLKKWLARAVDKGIGAGCGFYVAVKAAKNVLKNNISEKNMIKLAKKCVLVSKKIFNIEYNTQSYTNS